MLLATASGALYKCVYSRQADYVPGPLLLVCYYLASTPTLRNYYLAM